MNTTLQKKQRRILTPTETASLENAVQQDKEDKIETATTFPGASRFNVEDVQMKRIQKTLADGTPEPLSKAERLIKEKRSDVLREWLSKRMVPKKGVRLRSQSGGVQDPDFRKAVDLMARGEMSPEFQQTAEEYKNIMRELGRSDEANLENIRPN